MKKTSRRSSRQGKPDGKRWSGLLLILVLAAIGATVYQTLQPTDANALEITVYKTPSCGCCGQWVRYLNSEGFKVKTANRHNLSAVKKAHGIKPEYEACHTAVVDGYVVEGHVPADVIKRLLREQPSIKGIAVPGMPLGSPGMKSETPEPYKILTFDEAGNTTVFETRGMN